jgi:hypothetical protein
MVADSRGSVDYRMKVVMMMVRECCVPRREVKPYISRDRDHLVKMIPFDVP